jgi:transposase-like protein
MFEPQSNPPVTRPTNCPFCESRAIDTLAKVITVTTFWRCRACESTWTIASQQSAPARRP